MLLSSLAAHLEALADAVQRLYAPDVVAALASLGC